MADRRKHSKITSILPKELVEAINQQLVSGATYEQIAEFVRNEGHEISKSSVGRYGKNFMSKMERLRVVKEQAKAICTESQDKPALEMTEAATQLALQLIMERLVITENLNDAKSGELFKALALLERSAVAREKLKLDANKLLEIAGKRLKEELQTELAKQPELLGKLVDIVDHVVEDVKERQK